MALAMIVSVIAPAAGVFAAAKLTLTSTNKTLHLSGEPGSNKYNFNINGTKEKGWKYLWTSSNEDVAEVNASNGVTTATGIGTANITVVITDKKGKEVETLTAKVTVKDNIKTVKIANAPDRALAIDEEYDFNRSYVTLAGSETKTTAITRWSLAEATDKATITENDGKFKATEAGKYTVVARSFQSKAKYEEWKTTKAANLLLAEDSVEVTVAIGLKEVKQITLNKFTAEFDADMSKADFSTAKVYQIINGTAYETGTEKIKEVKVEGKVATVELYADLRQETEYKFVYGDLSATFKSAKVAISEVTELRFDDFDVNIYGSGFDMYTKVAGLNANGVEIYAPAANSDLTGYVSFKYEGNNVDGYQANNLLYIFKEGYSDKVTATFENYVFNNETKQYDTIKFSDAAIAKGVKSDDSLNTASIQYALVNSGNPASDSSAWTDAKTVPQEDGGYLIYTRYKLNSDPSNAGYRYSYDANTTNNPVTFKYVTTNADKLLVAGNSIFPVAQGTVAVLVYKVDSNNNETLVGSFDVLIQGKRAFVGATAAPAYVSVGNNVDHAETADVKITSKDSMNQNIPASVINGNGAIGYTWERVPSVPAGQTVVEPNVVISRTPAWNDASQITVSVTGKNAAGVPATVGAYQLKVSLTAYGATKDVFITVQVLDGNNNTNVVRWAVELDPATVDLKDNANQTVAINVYGYNSNNVRVDKLDTSEYDVTVKKSNGQDAGNYTAASIAAVRAVSGGAVQTYGVDNYLVTATVLNGGTNHPTKKATGAVIQAVQFEVKNTSVTDKKVVSTAIDSNTVFNMTKAAFDFKLNGDNFDANEAQIYKVRYSIGASPYVDAYENDANDVVVTAGNNLRVDSVVFRVAKTVGGNTTYIDYTIGVGVTVTAK